MLREIVRVLGPRLATPFAFQCPFEDSFIVLAMVVGILSLLTVMAAVRRICERESSCPVFYVVVGTGLNCTAETWCTFLAQNANRPKITLSVLVPVLKVALCAPAATPTFSSMV